MNQRIGKFEQADGGTLFLDEIGEMPLATQAKILRVLQESELNRIGSNHTIHVDVRIIAATNRDLYAQVLARQFREDLYYRLNVFTIHLPSLRERKSDIPLLVQHLLQRIHLKNPSLPHTPISEEALTCLTAYHWPGNIRQLENCLQHALVLCQGNTILPIHLPQEIQEAIQHPTPLNPHDTTNTLEALAQQLANKLHPSQPSPWPQFIAHLTHHLQRLNPTLSHEEISALINIPPAQWQAYQKESAKLHPAPIK
jgi:DNA-binding NtrC family response regulator